MSLLLLLNPKRHGQVVRPSPSGGGGGTSGSRRLSVRQDRFENPYVKQKRKKKEEDDLREKLLEAQKIKQLAEWEEEELLFFLML
jgi:hypothetical protein